MKFDNALLYLGDFGRYQRVVYYTLCVMSIPTAWHSLGNTFLSASPDHHCSPSPGSAYNASPAHDAARACYVPRRADGSWDPCRLYANASSAAGPGGDDGGDGGGCDPEQLGEPVPCPSGWVYDRTFYERTAVTEWDVVCDKGPLRQLSKTLVMVGKMVGSLICGQLADLVGRKKAFTLAILLMVGAGTGAAFVTDFTVFLVMQFLLGVSASGTFVVAIVIATEMVGKSQRAHAGIVIEYFYSVGYMSMALIAWRLRDWHSIELAISLPAAIFLSYYFIVPESPRWLLSKGRVAEAEKIVRRAAKVNKVSLPDSVFDDEDSRDVKEGVHTPKKTYSFIDLIRYPTLRKRMLNIYFNWMSNNLVYYGLSFFTEDLGSNPYLSFFISGAVEIPALILCQLLLGRIGRKWLITSFMTVGGVSLLCVMAIPQELTTLTMVIAMVGKLCITGSYAVVYLYAIELFPTPVRNVGVGMGSFVARIGSIASPYVLLLGEYTFFQLPFLVFGAFALAAGALNLLLPETLGAKLPETMEEGEEFGKNMTFREIFRPPCCRTSYSAVEDSDPKKEPIAMEMTFANVGVQTDDNVA